MNPWLIGVGAFVAWRLLQRSAFVVSHTMTNAAGEEIDTIDHTFIPGMKRLDPLSSAARGAAPSDVAASTTSPLALLFSNVAAAFAPTAGGPGGAPSILNPNPAGPILAPQSFAPIPAYSDPIAAPFVSVADVARAEVAYGGAGSTMYVRPADQPFESGPAPIYDPGTGYLTPAPSADAINAGGSGNVDTGPQQI